MTSSRPTSDGDINTNEKSCSKPKRNKSKNDTTTPLSRTLYIVDLAPTEEDKNSRRRKDDKKSTSPTRKSRSNPRKRRSFWLIWFPLVSLLILQFWFSLYVPSFFVLETQVTHIPQEVSQSFHAEDKKVYDDDGGEGASFVHEEKPNNKHDQWAAYLIAMQRYETRIRNSNNHINNNNDLQPNVYNLKELPKSSLYNTTVISSIARRGLTPPSTRKAVFLNMIRIPKAGSSHLSVTGRALAGCQPDGYPCCRLNPDTVNVCPRKDLYCDEVKGCTNHFADFNTAEPSITQFRSVGERVVSGFFYGGMHNVYPCYSEWAESKNAAVEDLWPCFEEYVASVRYANVTTRMMNGEFAYPGIFKKKTKVLLNRLPAGMNEANIAKAKKRICSLAWYGIVELPMASQLMLYEMEPFRRLAPNPVMFNLEAMEAGRRKSGDVSSLAAFAAAAEESDNKSVSDQSSTTPGRRQLKSQAALSDKMKEQASNLNASDYVRKNENVHYEQFRSLSPFADIISSGSSSMTRGEALVRKHNGADVEIYDFALGLFCARLKASGLMEEDAHIIHEAASKKTRQVKFRYQHHFDLCRHEAYNGATAETFCRDEE